MPVAFWPLVLESARQALALVKVLSVSLAKALAVSPRVLVASSDLVEKVSATDVGLGEEAVIDPATGELVAAPYGLADGLPASSAGTGLPAIPVHLSPRSRREEALTTIRDRWPNLRVRLRSASLGCITLSSVMTNRRIVLCTVLIPNLSCGSDVNVFLCSNVHSLLSQILFVNKVRGLHDVSSHSA